MHMCLLTAAGCWHRARRSALLPLALLGLAACTGSTAPGDPDDPAPAPPPSASAAQGCSWTKVFDPGVDNLAFPDTSANYWLALVPNPGPLGRIRLHGAVPEVRYYAFNSYDASSSPYDAIADFEIAPEAQGHTPFLGPVQVDRSIPAGAAYTVELVFSDVPEVRASNTIYSARLASVAGVALPNTQMAMLIYRTYLPKGDNTGGAGLPEIRLQTGEGAELSLGTGDRCSALVKQVATAAGLSTVTGALNDTGLPPLPSQLPAPPGATSPPAFTVFYGIPVGLQNAGVPVPDELADSSSAGFFSTRSSRYAYAFFSRNHGGLFIVRGRAPTFVDGAGEPQLRYWSLCQNEFTTQRVFGCVADHQAQLDADGYYNVVVSDGDVRPAEADAAQGYSWLPWGPFYDAEFIVRNMLPSPAYPQAFQNIPRGTDPVSIAGDYFPVATYCDPLVFEQAARAGPPATVFAACRARAVQ
jgi:hypothetical protein